MKGIENSIDMNKKSLRYLQRLNPIDQMSGLVIIQEE